MPPRDRPLRVLLVVEEAAGLQVLRLLADGPHEVVRVLTSGSAPGSVKGFAERHGLPVADPACVRDSAFADELRALEVDLLLNVHALHVIDIAVLEAPLIGSFNLHPGPLPEYAGLNAPSWAVYHRETRHAVTLHWMAAELDAGPIAYVGEFEVTPGDTGLTVFAQCARHGVPLVQRLLDTAAADPALIPRRPQNPAKRRWFGRKPPCGGRLHWSRSAEEVTAFVRACDYHPFPSPWGHPVTYLDDLPIEVLKASATGEPTWAPPGTVGKVGEGGAWVAGGDAWVRVQRIRRDGRSLEADHLLRFGQRLTSMEWQEELA